MSSIVDATLSHLTNSPTPHHNCANLSALLLADGFTKLSESEHWKGKLSQGGKYFFTRNGSTIVAFVVGGKYEAGEGGMKIIGGHTDSPNFRIRPHSKSPTGPGKITQLSVECYGGGLWHTWFDRDLSIAGRVIVRNGEKHEAKLVTVKRPVCRIPSLCIHLQSGEERASFAPNKENNMQPVLSQFIEKALSGEKRKNEDTKEEGDDKNEWQKGHEPELLTLLASELSCSVDDIVDFELSLYDTQPAQLFGLKNEFLASARLDNQITCITGVTSLINYSNNNKMLDDDEDVSVICLFDHEEVGSASAIGAGSPILGEVVRRIPSSLNTSGKLENEDFHQCTIRRSFVLSIDMAHAIHPNYPAKHQTSHSPTINGGLVIKTNSNQRYTTNSFSGFIVREIGRKKKLPVQEFVVRNDCPCGSTIGPIISEKTGIRCVDAGLAQWSMHSCRESMGANDLASGVGMFEGFYELFRGIDSSCYNCE